MYLSGGGLGSPQSGLLYFGVYIEVPLFMKLPCAQLSKLNPKPQNPYTSTYAQD